MFYNSSLGTDASCSLSKTKVHINALALIHYLFHRTSHSSVIYLVDIANKCEAFCNEMLIYGGSFQYQQFASVILFLHQRECFRFQGCVSLSL